MWFWISCLLAGLSLHCLIWVLMRPAQSAGAAPGHVHHRALRLAWPWLDALAGLVAPSLSWRARRAFERRVQQAGMDMAWKPEHLAAAQLLSGLLGAVACIATMSLLRLDAGQMAIPALTGATLAAWLPWRKLADM